MVRIVHRQPSRISFLNKKRTSPAGTPLQLIKAAILFFQRNIFILQLTFGLSGVSTFWPFPAHDSLLPSHYFTDEPFGHAPTYNQSQSSLSSRTLIRDPVQINRGHAFFISGLRIKSAMTRRTSPSDTPL